MIKIAYLIQCHKDFGSVKRLAERLKTENSDVYVHVDGKNVREKTASLYDSAFAVPDEKRVNVYWGDYSIVLASLSLIDAVICSGRKYDYIWLISGQDYPIKTTEYTERFLDENKGKAFIDTIPPDSERHKLYSKRNDVPHPGLLIGKSFASRAARKVYYFLTGGRKRTFAVFRRKSPVEYRFGSAWWCLPYSDVIKIKEYYDGNRAELDRFFSRSVCPDECFFQSLFHKVSDSETAASLTYIDWSGGKSSPKTLTSEDVGRLIGSDKLMARKFDVSVDPDVIDNIEVQLSDTISV